jgi:cytochrome c556
MKDYRPSRLLLLAPLAVLASCTPASEPADLPFGTTQQLMANEMQPTADIYWGAVGYKSELVNGVPVEMEWEPETDAEWQAVAASAAKIRDLANTMASPAYADERGAGWTDFTDGLAEAATRAEQAAQSKSADAVFEAGGTMYTVCKACHEAFPPEEVPEGEQAVDMTTQNND